MFTALWAQVMYSTLISDAPGCVLVHINQCEKLYNGKLPSYVAEQMLH